MTSTLIRSGATRLVARFSVATGWGLLARGGGASAAEELDDARR